MTGITVKEALTTHGFEGSRVVAGKSGLDNTVKLLPWLSYLMPWIGLMVVN